MLRCLYKIMFFKFKRKNYILQVLYIGVIIFGVIYSLQLVRMLNEGLFISCYCGQEVETNERVTRYLPSLLGEWNSITKRSVLEDVISEHQSLPVKFLADVEGLGERCNIIPGLFDIKHNNEIWQEARIGGDTLLLFSAFLDLRDEKKGPLVRILLMADSPTFALPFCQLYKSKRPSELPVATRALRVDFIHWDIPLENSWHPFMVTCKIDIKESVDLPDIVSLVSYPCSSVTNALTISGRGGKSDIQKKKLALCHKFIFDITKDLSFRLTEWIEASRAWGVDHITMYSSSVHPNVEKVLNHYVEEKYMTVLPWTNPGSQPNLPSLMKALYDTQRYVLFTDENIPYTDCVMRHIDTHQYVGIWDVDEFILPVKESSLPLMIDKAFKQWKEIHKDDTEALPPTSYLARASYFFDSEVNLDAPPSYLKNMSSKKNGSKNKDKWPPVFSHMLTHTRRSVKFTEIASFTKSIHDTSRVLSAFAHFAKFNLEGALKESTDLYHLYPNEEGYLAHYRSKCQGENQTFCDIDFRPFQTDDTTQWKHFEQIFSRSKRVLSSLNLI